MFARVNETLEKNLSKWDGLSALREIYDDFMKNYVKIKKLSDEQIKRPAALINAKNKLLNQLTEKVIPVANVLEVYLTGKNKKNYKKVKISKNKLLKSKDSKILKKCELVLRNSRKLFNKATKDAEKVITATSKTNIKDYGLTEVMLNDLEDIFNKYKAESEQVGDKLKKEIKITEKILTLVKKNNKLLKKKLDKLMIIFESKDPEFYEIYQKSRGLIMPGPVSNPNPTPKPKRTPRKRVTTRRKRTPTVKQSVNK
jgi:hypothetical protein